jgi:two-component system heavy metal sensor histidine kinase CusS
MPPRSSITVRLAALFACALAALSLGAGGYLYHALTLDVAGRDENELRGKLALAVEAAERLDSVEAGRAELAHVVVGHDHMRLYVVGPDERLLFASGPPRLPPRWRSSLLQSGRPTRFQDDSDALRVLGSRARLRSGERVQIFLELNTAQTDRLLDEHLREIVMAVALTTALGVAVAYGIARSGLRPLRQMANAAKRISAEHLEERLSVETAPRELRELAESFNAMLQRLQDSFARLGEYASDLAHEMRTPLSNLIGQTQVVLSRSRSAEDYRAALESNMEEFERLSRMVSDMLFIARAENPQTRVTMQPVDLRGVAIKTQQFYEPMLAEKDVRLVVEGAAVIAAEPLMIERAVSNLVSNAVRHADPGSEIAIRIAEKLTPSLEVSNRGRPIPPEVEARLFSRFARSDTGERSDGVGLGLAIVRSIMKLHNGMVTAQSDGEGETRFVLTFPAPSAASLSAPSAGVKAMAERARV